MSTDDAKQELMEALKKLDDIIGQQRDDSESHSPLKSYQNQDNSYIYTPREAKKLAKDIGAIVNKINTPINQRRKKLKKKQWDHGLLEKLLMTPTQLDQTDKSRSIIDRSFDRITPKNKQEYEDLGKGYQRMEGYSRIKQKPEINRTSCEQAYQKNNGVPIYKRYHQEIKKKESRLKELKHSADIRRELRELKELQFSPSCSSRNNQRRTSKSPDVISANIKKYQRLKDERLKKACEQNNTQNMKELTFQPRINQKSKSMIKRNTPRSISSIDVATNRLYSDASFREMRREEVKNDMIKLSCPFKPIVNDFEKSLIRQKRFRSTSPISIKGNRSTRGIDLNKSSVSKISQKSTKLSSKQINSTKLMNKKIEKKPSQTQQRKSIETDNFKNYEDGNQRQLLYGNHHNNNSTNLHEKRPFKERKNINNQTVKNSGKNTFRSNSYKNKNINKLEEEDEYLEHNCFNNISNSYNPSTNLIRKQLNKLEQMKKIDEVLFAVPNQTEPQIQGFNIHLERNLKDLLSNGNNKVNQKPPTRNNNKSVQKNCNNGVVTNPRLGHKVINRPKKSSKQLAQNKENICSYQDKHSESFSTNVSSATPPNQNYKPTINHLLNRLNQAFK